jgi:hypothetical protein
MLLGTLYASIVYMPKHSLYNSKKFHFSSSANQSSSNAWAHKNLNIYQ